MHMLIRNQVKNLVGGHGGGFDGPGVGFDGPGSGFRTGESRPWISGYPYRKNLN